jgi:hypothetical protein
MSNYVPWYGKKRASLKRREVELLRAIQRGDSSRDLVRVAEEVIEANLRALKSDLAQIPACGKDDNDTRAKRLREQISLYSSRNVEEVISEYRGRLTSKVHNKSVLEDKTVI